MESSKLFLLPLDLSFSNDQSDVQLDSSKGAGIQPISARRKPIPAWLSIAGGTSDIMFGLCIDNETTNAIMVKAESEITKYFTNFSNRLYFPTRRRRPITVK